MIAQRQVIGKNFICGIVFSAAVVSFVFDCVTVVAKDDDMVCCRIYEAFNRCGLCFHTQTIIVHYRYTLQVPLYVRMQQSVLARPLVRTARRGLMETKLEFLKFFLLE